MIFMELHILAKNFKLIIPQSSICLEEEKNVLKLVSKVEKGVRGMGWMGMCYDKCCDWCKSDNSQTWTAETNNTLYVNTNNFKNIYVILVQVFTSFNVNLEGLLSV